MANHLSMQNKLSAETLLRQKVSERKIARLLDIDRKSVKRLREELQKGPNPPTGDSPAGEKGPNPPAGNFQKGPNPPTGPVNACEPYREIIEKKLEKGRSRMGIHYDLVREHGAQVSYDSVKRFARQLTKAKPELVVRLEFPLGEAAQVDFGLGAPTIYPKTGKRRRPYLFVMTLCSSRKAYYEVVWQQDTRTFIECHKRGFAFFGGVPKAVILDNLKAAIIKACWEDPEINRHFALFARHTGFAVLPCHPASPTEKGIVESGVKYAQGIVEGRTFATLEEQNAYLHEWEERVASKRIHGTTKRQVDAMFAEEKPLLQALPAEPFELVTLDTRIVHLDGSIEVGGAYYPIPDEYLGETVEVRRYESMLRVFKGDTQIVAHGIVPRGHRAPRLFARSKEVPVSRTAYELERLAWATTAGESAVRLVHGALEARPIDGYRFLQGLPRMRVKYGPKVFDAAANEAAERGLFTSKHLRFICERIAADEGLATALLQEHELIRSMQEYNLENLTQRKA